MAKLKTKGVVIDTAQLKRSWQDLANATREEAANVAAEGLQAIIDALKANTSNRATNTTYGRRYPSPGTVDNPLEFAKVVKLIKRDVHDTRHHRVVVYVEHKSPDGKNIFNILDSGRKAKPVKKGFYMPAYRGHLTSPNSSGVDKPAELIGQAGSVKLLTPNVHPKYGFQMAKSSAEDAVLILYISPGTQLGGIEARHFYEAVAKWTEKELLSRDIVDKSRRTRMKLKKGDVIISVPDRPRFTGI